MLESDSTFPPDFARDIQIEGSNTAGRLVYLTLSAANFVARSFNDLRLDRLRLPLIHASHFFDVDEHRTVARNKMRPSNVRRDGRLLAVIATMTGWTEMGG